MSKNQFSNSTRRLIIGGLGLAFALSATAVQAKDNSGIRKTVENGIAKTMRLPKDVSGKPKAAATIAISLDSDGTARSIDIVKSTGYPAYDAEALRTARSISYPAPGKPRTIAMVLGFDQKVTAEMQKAARLQLAAWQNDKKVMLANNNHTLEGQKPDS